MEWMKLTERGRQQMGWARRTDIAKGTGMKKVMWLYICGWIT